MTTKSPLSPLFAAFLQELILDCWTLTHNNKKVNGGGANTRVGDVVTDLSLRAVSALCDITSTFFLKKEARKKNHTFADFISWTTQSTKKNRSLFLCVIDWEPQEPMGDEQPGKNL